MTRIVLKLLLCLLFRMGYGEQHSSVEEYLEELVLKKVNEAISYNFLKDNANYFEGLQGGYISEYGTFDFIIVGSGSTGSVLANRLSSVKAWKILLLEAGGRYDDFLDIPAMYSFALSSKHNWGYNTTSQKYGCKGMINNQCSYPRGKVLGGSSSVNGLIYTRGNPRDYDSWKELGISGWNYRDVEPYFQRMENAQFPGKDLGHSGPLYMNFSSPCVSLQKTFSQAFSELGILGTDYNSGKQLGWSRIQSNIKHGRRVSGANAYIYPASHRKNLNISVGAFVTNILINHNRTAYGVRFALNGRIYDALADKEIILSAGAINSPQILMLSGIGPEHLLNKYNIPLIKDLPVGETLVDHIAYNLQFSSNITQDTIPLKKQIADFLEGTGLLTAPFNGKSLSFISKCRERQPTVEYILLPPTGGTDYIRRSLPSPYIDSINDAYMSRIDPRTFFSITVILLHPKSYGTVSIKSANPKDFPLIDNRILSVEDDIEALYEAIQFAVNLTKTGPFRAINATVFSPVPPCQKFELYSKKYWYCAIEYMALPAYHSMGTTPMGSNPIKSVVNQELKVHDVSNLRIADCGVIPSSISGHTSGPGFMIGEKLASMLNKEYGMTNELNNERMENR